MDRDQYRERVLAESGFREDPANESWFNLKKRKSLTHEALRDYDEISWKATLSSIVPASEFWFYSLGALAFQVCEKQLARWNLQVLRPVIKAYTSPGQPPVTVTIDDPKYWEPLSDEEVVEKMRSGQPDSLIWLRAQGELTLRRELREASRRKSEGDSGVTPAVPAANFGCIKSKRLREIAERDWEECSKALNAGCWKSVLVLSGGIVEAILLSKLSHRRSAARKTRAAKGGDSDLDSWTLGKMIAAAKELKLLGPEIEMLPAPMKDYRNLAHPGYEVRHKLSISEKSARASFHVLSLILEELEKAAPIGMPSPPDQRSAKMKRHAKKHQKKRARRKRGSAKAAAALAPGA